MNGKLLFAIVVISTTILACSSGGLPPGGCDPGGPGPVYEFRKTSDGCEFTLKIECNAGGEVRDSCTTNVERRLAYENFVRENTEQFTPTDLCMTCANNATCPFQLRELAGKVCDQTAMVTNTT